MSHTETSGQQAAAAINTTVDLTALPSRASPSGADEVRLRQLHPSAISPAQALPVMPEAPVLPETVPASGSAGTRKLRPVPGAVLANTADTVAALGTAMVQADHVAKRFQDLVKPAISKPRWCSQCKSHLRAYKKTNFCTIECAIKYRRAALAKAENELAALLDEAAGREAEREITVADRVEAIEDFLGVGREVEPSSCRARSSTTARRAP